MRGSYGLAAWCKCGGTIDAKGVGEMDAVKQLLDAFWSVHTGEGHGSATSQQAARARRRLMREAVKS